MKRVLVVNVESYSHSILDIVFLDRKERSSISVNI